ncbi:ATP-binding protein [Ekhidna sp.]
MKRYLPYWFLLITALPFSAISQDFAVEYTDSVLLKHADTLWKSGKHLRKKGLYHTALQNYYEALQIYEEMDSVRLSAKVMNSIGILNSELDDPEKALEFFKRTMTMYEELGDQRQIAFTLNNIGLESFYQGNYEEASYYLNKSVALKKELGMSEKTYAYANFGRIHLAKGDYDSALIYFKKAIDALQKSEVSTRDSLEILNDLGRTYFILEKYDIAKKYLKESLKIGLGDGTKTYNVSNSHHLAQIYSLEGSIEEALYYSQMHNAYTDSLNKEKNSKTVARIEMKYLLGKVEEKNAKAIQDKNRVIFVTIVGLIFLICFIVFIIYNHKKNKKATELIARKNEEISEQRIQKLEQEKELNAIKGQISGQEKERKRIAEELHDGIGGSLSGIKLALVSLEEDVKNAKLSPISDRIDTVCREVRTIAHNLAPPSLEKTTFTNALNEYIGQFKSQAQIDIIYQLFPEKDLDLLPKNMQIELYRIIQEGLANVTRHAKATYLEVQLTHHGNYLNLIIEDNGVGFDSSKLKEGIGLANIQSRVDILNGKLEIDSQLNRGTVINIDIDIHKDRNLYGTIKEKSTSSG